MSESKRRTSSELTRSQLVCIIAELRGALFSATRSPEQEDIDDAEMLLKETAFDTADEDLVNDSFDRSWRGER